MLDCAVIYTLFLQNKAQKLSYVNHKYCAHRWVAKDTWIFHFLFMCARSVRRVGRSSDRVGLTHKEYGDFTFTLSSAPPPPPKKSVKVDDGCQRKLGTEVHDREMCFVRHSANLMEFTDLTAIRYEGYDSVGG